MGAVSGFSGLACSSRFILFYIGVRIERRAYPEATVVGCATPAPANHRGVPGCPLLFFILIPMKSHMNLATRFTHRNHSNSDH